MSKGNKELSYWQTVLKIYLKEHKELLKYDVQKFHTLTGKDISDLDLSDVKTIQQLEKKVNTRIGLLDILEAYHLATVRTISENSEYYQKEIKSRNFEIALHQETITDLLEHQLSKLKTINQKAA
jgi:hypothetical protein